MEVASSHFQTKIYFQSETHSVRISKESQQKLEIKHTIDITIVE